MNSNSAEEDSLFNEVGNFYMNNDKLHDVQFIVGEQKEKIKAVRLPLINQSRTWWSMLSEDSPLAEKGDINLPDIDPDVFNLLLKHCYGGLDMLDNVSDDIAMKLCYCANKYFMKSLMDKVASRLAPTNVKELFPALHCLVYYNLQGVENSVKKIVQSQATRILEDPEFLECDVDSVTYICKQETLNCDELTIWKAVVNWAKHKAPCSSGAQLRLWVAAPLQHIRLITLDAKDLRDHVLSLDILNSDEIVNICKGDVSGLKTLCNVKESRCLEKTVIIKPKSTDRDRNSRKAASSCSLFMIGNQCMNLKSLVFKGGKKDSSYNIIVPAVDVSLKITRLANVENISKTKEHEEETISLQLRNVEPHNSNCYTVPTLINGKGVTLQANSQYKVELSFSDELPCWYHQDCAEGHYFDHGVFKCSWNYVNGVGYPPCHILQFTYQVANY